MLLTPHPFDTLQDTKGDLDALLVIPANIAIGLAHPALFGERHSGRWLPSSTTSSKRSSCACAPNYERAGCRLTDDKYTSRECKRPRHSVRASRSVFRGVNGIPVCFRALVCHCCVCPICCFKEQSAGTAVPFVCVTVQSPLARDRFQQSEHRRQRPCPLRRLRSFRRKAALSTMPGGSDRLLTIRYGKPRVIRIGSICRVLLSSLLRYLSR